MKIDCKSAAAWGIAGLLVGAGSAFLLLSCHFREENRRTFELYTATLASTRLAALQTLRDGGGEAALAQLENALVSDRKALELIDGPESTTRMLLDRIRAYQKLYPPPAAVEENE